MSEKQEKQSELLTYQLSRKLVFLASLLLIGIIVILGSIALEPAIQRYEDRIKYDDNYFDDAVVNYGSYESDADQVVAGVHVATGMKIGKGFAETRAACTGCHSPKLITQNRASRAGWKQMIRWMQATQGLPDLGKSETIILDYLAEQYAPEQVGRRANLDMDAIEWFVLNLDQ